MDWNTYKIEAMKNCADREDMVIDGQKREILIAIMGLAGEVGEIVEYYKKHLFHGHDVDLKEVEKEIGDVMWYMNLLCSVTGIDLENALQANIDKLRARYGEHFSSEASKNRIEDYKGKK